MSGGIANQYYPQDPKEHNRRLFTRIHADLASDDSAVFTHAANKLTKFLSRIDAYYPEAHSQILQSLQTARETLTRLSNSSVPFHCNQPYPKNLEGRRLAYKALVETVVNFSAQFGQVGTAHETLKQLALSVQSSEEAIAVSTSPEQGVPHQNRATNQSQGHAAGATLQPFSLGSFANSEQQNPTLPTDSIASITQSRRSLSTNSSGNISTPRKATSPSVDSASPFQSVGEMVTPSATSGDVHNATATQQGRSNIPTSKTEDLTSGGGSSTPATAKPKRKPKLIAKKQPLPQAVVQDDFKHWKERKGAAGRVVTPSKPAAPTVATTSSAAMQEPAITSKVYSDQTSRNQNTPANPSSQSPKLEDKVNIVNPKVKTPEVIDLTLEDIQVGSNDRTDAFKGAIVPDAGIASSSIAPIEHGEMDEPMDIEECNPNQTPGRLDREQTMTSSSSRDAMIVEKSVTLLDKDHFVGRQSPMSGVELLTNRSSVPEVEDLHPSEGRTGATSMEAVENGLSDVEMQNPAGGEQSKQQSTAPKAQSRRPSFERKTNGGNIGHTSANGQDAQVGASRNCKSEEPRPISPPIVSVFEPQTVVLASYNLGKAAGEITIDFEVASGMETFVTLWKTRFNHDHDLTHGSCLSLACYRLDHFADTEIDMKETGDSSDICKVLLSARPSWPDNGILQARIGNKCVFLSPPAVTTRDGFVDLAPHVDGRNLLIKLEHGADLTNYVFALFSHPPTPNQLRDLRDRRRKDEQWKASLRNICRPFTKEEIDNS